jgi:hypothetical protein
MDISEWEFNRRMKQGFTDTCIDSLFPETVKTFSWEEECGVGVYVNKKFIGSVYYADEKGKFYDNKEICAQVEALKRKWINSMHVIPIQ